MWMTLKKQKNNYHKKTYKPSIKLKNQCFPFQTSPSICFTFFQKLPVSWLLHNSFTLLRIISFVLISFEKCHWSILELLLKVFVYFMYTLVLLNNSSNVRWQQVNSNGSVLLSCIQSFHIQRVFKNLTLLILFHKSL